MIRTVSIRLTCLVALTAAGLAQQTQEQQDPKPAPPPPTEQQKEQLLAEVKQQFEKEGITIDAKAMTVTVKAKVNNPQDPIEYLLIHRRGKRHEAIFMTLAKPSVLNGALLMLGLTPGKNATYVEKTPPPTLEEIQKGADPLVITPPQGVQFWMTVRWPGADGKVQEHCVEDMVLDLGKQKPIRNCSWVFLGGRMARIYKGDPEVFVADFEGNLVSTCYLSPDNHLATMVHDQARDDQNWWTTALVPPPDTEVEFVFHKTITPLHLEREKRLLKEDAEEKAKAGTEKGDVKEPPKEAKEPEAPPKERGK